MHLLFFALFKVVVIDTPFLFVKRLFSAMTFSHFNNPQHPKIQALLS
ncbi:hypothetical protein ACQJ5C_07010 [Helicobacter pylori]